MDNEKKPASSRRREKINELLRYCLAGVLTTMIDYGTTWIMSRTGKHAWLDSIVAWVVSVVFFAFWMYKFFVFRSKTMEKKTVFFEFVAFIAARLFTLGFQTLFMWVFVDLLGFRHYLGVARVIDGAASGEFFIKFPEYWIFKLMATVIVTILNYIFSKLIIFNPRGPVSRAGEGSTPPEPADHAE